MSFAPAHHTSFKAEGPGSRLTLAERLVVTVMDGVSSRLDGIFYGIEPEEPDACLSEASVAELELQGYQNDDLIRMSVAEGYLLRQLALSPDAELKQPLKDAILTIFPDDRAFCATGNIAMSPETYNVMAAEAPQVPGFNYSYIVPVIAPAAPEDNPAP